MVPGARAAEVLLGAEALHTAGWHHQLLWLVLLLLLVAPGNLPQVPAQQVAWA
jgi:hypothetical protein